MRKNLRLALNHLRLESEPRVLWIDAICINQRDIHERNYKVTQMAQIYEQAERVVVWLGPSDASSKLAFDLLPFPHKWVGFAQKSTDPEVLAEGNQKLAAFYSLLTRKYWRRLWIIQEFLFAKDFVLQCGNDSCSQFRFSYLMRFLGRTRDVGRNLSGWRDPQAGRHFELYCPFNSISAHVSTK